MKNFHWKPNVKISLQQWKRSPKSEKNTGNGNKVRVILTPWYHCRVKQIFKPKMSKNALFLEQILSVPPPNSRRSPATKGSIHRPHSRVLSWPRLYGPSSVLGRVRNWFGPTFEKSFGKNSAPKCVLSDKQSSFFSFKQLITNLSWLSRPPFVPEMMNLRCWIDISLSCCTFSTR